jgi:hypothetical protein
MDYREERLNNSEKTLQQQKVTQLIKSKMN